MSDTIIDHSHEPLAHSWVASASGHPEFPLQNLPFGVYSAASAERRIGVAIGDLILDIGACINEGLLDPREAGAACASDALNDLMALPQRAMGNLRREISTLLRDGTETGSRARSIENRLLVARRRDMLCRPNWRLHSFTHPCTTPRSLEQFRLTTRCFPL